MVSSKDLVEEIAISPDTSPIVLKAEPTFFKKFKHLVGASCIGAAAIVVALYIAKRDNAGDDILTLPPTAETNNNAAPQSEPKPQVKAEVITPKAWARPLKKIEPAKEISVAPLDIPFAYASIIKLPDLKIGNLDLSIDMPEFLSLKSMATILLPEGEEPDAPIMNEIGKADPIEVSSSGNLASSQFENANTLQTEAIEVKTLQAADYQEIRSQLEKKKLAKNGGDAFEAWQIREAGEALINLPGATITDHENAFVEFLKAANRGDARAQYLAGECLFYGKGTTKNINRAVYYLEKAANQKESRAMNLFGVCLVRGLGVEIDETRAVKLFQAAVDQGIIPAYYNLGARYAQGQGVPRNASIAADLFQIGAQRGNDRCMLIYARCFEAGFGRNESHRKAIQWFQKAAQQGNKDAIKWCDTAKIATL